MTTLDDRATVFGPDDAGPDDIVHTTVVLASSWDVLRYVTDPANLADFLPGVIEAHRAAGDDIVVTVKTDDGPQDITATLRLDESAHRVDWFVPGREYRGRLVVDGGSVMTQLRVHLHLGHPLSEADHRQVQHLLGILRHQIELSVY